MKRVLQVLCLAFVMSIAVSSMALALDPPDPGLPGPYNYLFVPVNSINNSNGEAYVNLKGYINFWRMSPNARHFVTNWGMIDKDRDNVYDPGDGDDPNPNIWVLVQWKGHRPLYYGGDRFPLVVIVHGQHPVDINADKYSYNGYEYLTMHLASHGMVSISINEEFLNDYNDKKGGEEDARTFVLLKCLENILTGSPFKNYIDINKVGLVGHSRGGEAIAGAWYYWRYFPSQIYSNYTIKSLFAIAPSDRGMTLRPINPTDPADSSYPIRQIFLDDINYYVMHGSYDGDLTYFPGMQMYDRAFWYKDDCVSGEFSIDGLGYDQDFDSSGMTPVISKTKSKGMTFVYGATHDFWNDVWFDKINGVGSLDSTSEIYVGPLEGRLTYQRQQSIGKSLITAWFKKTLSSSDDGKYDKFFKGADSAIPTGTYGYTGYVPEGTHVGNLTQRYEEPNTKYIKTFEDTASIENIGSIPPFNVLDIATGLDTVGWFNLLHKDLIPGEGHCLEVKWNTAPSPVYTIDNIGIPSNELDGYNTLAFDVARVYENPEVYNNSSSPVQIAVSISTYSNTGNDVDIWPLHKIVYPDHAHAYPYGIVDIDADMGKTVFDTVRIPLGSFITGLTADQIRTIDIVFEDQKGWILIDNIRFAK